jgi:predicted esterase
MATLVIALHGSGGSGSELRMVFEAVPLQQFHGHTFRQVADLSSTELCTPTAPERPYRPCLNERMNVWFNRSADFMTEGMDSAEDLAGVDESLAQVRIAR